MRRWRGCGVSYAFEMMKMLAYTMDYLLLYLANFESLQLR